MKFKQSINTFGRRKNVHATKPDGTESPEISIFRMVQSILTGKCLKFIEFLRYVFNALSPTNHA
ncbi:MAG: hypothetical protein ACOYPR_17435, partial [Saprospiraceae bacterium]